jgi:hypothetical protein
MPPEGSIREGARRAPRRFRLHLECMTAQSPSKPPSAYLQLDRQRVSLEPAAI